MTTQTFRTANDPDTTAVQGIAATPLSSRSSPRSRLRRVRCAVATAALSAVAVTAFGVTRQIRADDGPTVVPQRATEADLQFAAEWAREVEILAPELSRMSPRPASYTDLRLAAEWARRLEILSAASE